MPLDPGRIERWAGWTPWAVLAYFTLQTALRLTISGNLEIDEAEIARHVDLQLGYANSQPPLYEWLVISLWKLSGSWPVSVAVAKNASLAATYCFSYWSGRVLFGNRAGAALLALSLLFMPQIVWQSQITLSHSVLAVAASAALLTSLVLLIERRSIQRFIGLGFALGAALLSKYDVLILVVGLAGAFASIPDARRRLASGGLVLSGLIATVIASPHMIWAVENIEKSTARLSKLAEKHGPGFDLPFLGIDGLDKLIVGVAASSFLLAFMWMVARRLSRNEMDVSQLTDTGLLFGRIAGRALAIGLAFCAITVLLDDVHNVHERYLTPLLMLVPFWLGLRFPLAYRPHAVRGFLLMSALVAVLVSVAWPQLALFGPHRFAYPYDTLAKDIAPLAGPAPAILMKRPDYATNFVLRLPGARLFDRNVRTEAVIALWESQSESEQKNLIESAGPCYRPSGAAHELAAPYHYFSGRQARLSFVRLQLDAERPDSECTASVDGASDLAPET